MKSQLKRKRRTLRENVERNAMNWLMRTGDEVDALQHDVYPENFYPVPDDTTEDSYMFEFDIDSVEDGENVVREGHDMSKKFVKILKAAGYEAYTIYRPSRDGETFVGLKVNNPTQKSLSESKKKSDIEMLAESVGQFLVEDESSGSKFPQPVNGWSEFTPGEDFPDSVLDNMDTSSHDNIIKLYINGDKFIAVTNDGDYYKEDAEWMLWHPNGTKAHWDPVSLMSNISKAMNSEKTVRDPLYRT